MSSNAPGTSPHRRFWITVLCFAIANTAVWIGYMRWEYARHSALLEVAQFTPGDGAKVEGRPTLIWSFNRDVLPPGDKPPVQISPPVAGAWQWRDRRTLTFIPNAPLQQATPYTFTLAPDVLSTPGGFRLARPFVSSLKTPPLRLAAVRQVAFDQADRVVIELAFNDTVLPAEVQKHLRLFGSDGREITFHPHGQAPGRAIRVITDSVATLLSGSGAPRIDVKLARGLRGQAGPLGLPADDVRQLQIAADLIATEAEGWYPTRETPSIVVRFNNEVDGQAIGRVVSIEPPVAFTTTAEGSTLELHGAFEAGARYAIRIAAPPPGLPSKKLPRPAVLSVRVPDREPGLWFEQAFGYLGAHGNRTLMAHAVNTPDVRVAVCRVYDSNLVAWRNASRSRRGYGADAVAFGQPVASRTIHLLNKKNERQDVPISLDDLLPAGETRDGVYQITLMPAGQNAPVYSTADDENDDRSYAFQYGGASTVVTLSDIGLCARQARDAITIWATSLRSASPLPGVHVRVYSNKNQLMCEGVTSADGLATLPLLPTSPGEKAAIILAEEQPAAQRHDDADAPLPSTSVAEKASASLAPDRAAPRGLTWLDLRSGELNFSDTPIGGRPYLRSGFEAYVYTDRGVYRPGETIHLRAIVRGPDNAMPQRFPIIWQIRRPNLRDWKSQGDEIDADGASALDLSLPADLPTGRWTAHVGLAGTGKDAARFFGSVAFEVEDFLPQRMKVDLRLQGAAPNAGRDRIAIDAQPAIAQLQADYRFGRPVADRAATLIARVDPAPFAPPTMHGWAFGDTGNTAEALGGARPTGHRFELSPISTNAGGRAAWPLDLVGLIGNQPGSKPSHDESSPGESAGVESSHPPAYAGPWRLTLAASVTETGGRAVTATRAIDIDRAPHYIALRARETAPRPGANVAFDVRLVTPAGLLHKTNAKLLISLYRESWNSSYVQDRGGYRFQSTRVLELQKEAGRDVNVQAAQGQIAIVPRVGGSYVLIAREANTDNLTSLRFYAGYGAWDDNVSRENPERLEVLVQPLPPSYDTQHALDAMLRLDAPGLSKAINRAAKRAHEVWQEAANRDAADRKLRGNAPIVPVAGAANGVPARAGAPRLPRPGDAARVIVRSPFPGRLLLTIETDRVVTTKVLDMPGTSMAIPIDISDAMRPNAYVTATVLRGIDPSAKWAIHRAVGVTRILLDASPRKLLVQLAAPAEVRPARSLAVPLRVLDSLGNPVANATVSVAAVDEGICALTHFATPDPFRFFTAPRALGVRTCDLYNLLMPEVPRPAAQSAVGGDDGSDIAASHVSPIAARRVAPVALVSAVLHTDARGFAQADFPLPEFIGQLRVMAVASKANGFGSADTPVLVRSPLVVQSSWPRFASPGDRFSVPLTLFNNSARSGEASVSLQLDDSGPARFAANGSTKLSLEPIPLAPGGQGTASFDVICRNQTGVAHAHLLAHLNGEVFEEHIELPIRPASPAVSVGGYLTAKPGTPAELTVPAGFLPGTTKYELRVCSVPELNLPKGLDYLDRYPYGCLEQTASTLFPLVYLDDFGARLSPGLFDRDRVAEKVRIGIARLMSMQTADGGLAMWPGGGEAWPWGTVYATNFLIEARAAGFNVPDEFRAQLLSYVRAQLAKPEDDAGTIELHAYAAYVLALAGRPERAVMSRLGELAKTENASADGEGTARIHLAAAWLAAGRRDLAAALLPQAIPPARKGRELAGNLASPIRDRAILINTMLAVDPDDARIPDLVRKLADDGRADGWRSTQDMAFSVLAIGRYLRRASAQTPYASVELLRDGKRIASAESGKPIAWLPDSPPAPGSKLQVRVTGAGAATAHIAWLQTGVALQPPADADHGLQIRRRYLDERGKPIGSAGVRSGDLVRVELTVRAPGAMENLAIEDLLPAGLEIENPRLRGTAANLAEHVQPSADAVSDSGADDEEPPPVFQALRVDRRDDRLMVMGRLTRAGTGKYIYTARAITSGAFVLGPVQAQCMYDSTINSTAGAGTFKVLSARAIPGAQASAGE